jgi:benzoyl-CoA reductase/2-hydroxyglutaryl-CoA dehydratase subunit BcrC/BadD/HgdB
MNRIAYCQPLVPPEWIAAHGLRPDWLRPQSGGGEYRPDPPEMTGATVGLSNRVSSTAGQASSGTLESAAGPRRGVCPVAAGLIDAVARGFSAAALVLTTTCDQMRYAAAVLENLNRLPVFLMHVPRTWQTTAVRAFYGEELRRLGRFLVRCGGTAPTAETLRRTMVRYGQAREELRHGRDSMPAREFSEAVAAVRGCLTASPLSASTPSSMFLQERPLVACGFASDDDRQKLSVRRTNGRVGEKEGIPLALVGGPMPAGDPPLLERIEQAGGRIVLDATESGQRTLPAPFGDERLQADPFEELVRAYFDAIPEVFRRPNDRLYEWLRQEVAGRGVRGLLVRRYLWCDLWHAELPRLRQECSLPVLEWDAIGDAPTAGDLGRLEAFLEMLR